MTGTGEKPSCASGFEHAEDALLHFVPVCESEGAKVWENVDEFGRDLVAVRRRVVLVAHRVSVLITK